MLRNILILLLIFFIVGALTWKRAFHFVGNQLIKDSTPVFADAAVVLNTGVEYYPRLLHAAKLYREGRVSRVVINGNRKTDVLRAIESDGFTSCCDWYADRLRILELYGVAKKDVIVVSAEDAFDTISEARAVGAKIFNSDIKSIILTTSKFHSRRACHIWGNMYGEVLEVFVSPADQDPFNPHEWWKSARQIRWVMAETGAWAFLYWTWLTQ